MLTPKDQLTATTPKLPPHHPLRRVDYPNGEWMPRMWDQALLVMADDAAGSAKILKAVAFSHGYSTAWVCQEVPADLLYVSPDVVLPRVVPPTDAPIEGALCGRTVDDGWIYNWYVAPVNPAATALVGVIPATASAGGNLARLRAEWGKVGGSPGKVTILKEGEPFMGQPADAGWTIMCGDWRDELVAIHGPNGHIASGLTMEQATALVDAHGAAVPGVTAAKGAE